MLFDPQVLNPNDIKANPNKSFESEYTTKLGLLTKEPDWYKKGFRHVKDLRRIMMMSRRNNPINVFVGIYQTKVSIKSDEREHFYKMITAIIKDAVSAAERHHKIPFTNEMVKNFLDMVDDARSIGIEVPLSEQLMETFMMVKLSN